MNVPSWALAREDNTWVGPISYATTDVDGNPVAATVTFAVIPVQLGVGAVRPQSTDWQPPAVNTADPTKVGVRVTPVTSPALYGIWAQAVTATDTIVLGPDVVGFIRRT